MQILGGVSSGQTYTYHVFTSSGTLTVTSNGSVEVVSVGGGASGGGGLGGGAQHNVKPDAPHCRERVVKLKVLLRAPKQATVANLAQDRRQAAHASPRSQLLHTS